VKITKVEYNNETEYLNLVMKIITDELMKLNVNLGEKAEYINEYKSYMWDSKGDMDNIEIASNIQSLDNQVATANTFVKKRQQMIKSKESPYFGRIDFIRKNEEEKKIYIGISSVVSDYSYFVYDWRAPISSMFYDYGIGIAEYVVPNGTKIIGEITLRRQYRIEEGKLLRCFDSDLNIVDEFLQDALDITVSNKLKNIVTTIQSEQNQVIRNIQDKIMVVQGVAGSGKTTVALHRIAYLLYKNRDLSSNSVLIFSPNRVFAEYISDVLPDLGEENALQTTFSEFVKSQLKFEVESFSNFIMRYQETDIGSSEFKLVSFKFSSHFKDLIDEYVNEIKNNLYFVNDLTVGNKTFTSQKLTELVKSRFFRHPIKESIEYLAEYLCDLAILRGKRKVRQITKQLNEIINQPLDLRKLYKNLVNSASFFENCGVDQNTSKGRRGHGQLSYEDGLGMLYLQSKLSSLKRDRTIEHIIIDEAQDYSPVQFELLRRIFSAASFTILGDKHQTINPFHNYNSLNQIGDAFHKGIKYIELNKTYRSTAPIVKYSNNILGLKNVMAIRSKSSDKVVEKLVSEHQIVQELIQDLQEMKREELKNLAIITKTVQYAKKVYEKISDSIDANLIISPIDNYSKNIVVLPVHLAKGLEFDGVIVCTDGKERFTEKDKSVFYVACTRALHRLVIYNK